MPGPRLDPQSDDPQIATIQVFNRALEALRVVDPFQGLGPSVAAVARLAAAGSPVRTTPRRTRVRGEPHLGHWLPRLRAVGTVPEPLRSCNVGRRPCSRLCRQAHLRRAPERGCPLPKLDIGGSNPLARSTPLLCRQTCPPESAVRRANGFLQFVQEVVQERRHSSRIL